MIGNLVYINTSRMKKDGKKDEKATEAEYVARHGSDAREVSRD